MSLVYKAVLVDNLAEEKIEVATLSYFDTTAFLSARKLKQRHVVVNLFPVICWTEVKVARNLAIGSIVNVIRWDKLDDDNVQQKLNEYQVGLSLTLPISFLKSSNERWFNNKLFTSGINYANYFAYENQKWSTRMSSTSNRDILVWNHLLFYQFVGRRGFAIKIGTGIVSSYLLRQKVSLSIGDSIDVVGKNTFKIRSEPIFGTLGWAF